MSVRLCKPWQPLCPERVGRLPAQLGVYQIADPGGRILRIGYAGGRSLFGLRGALQQELQARGEGASRFRVEITMQYLTRFEELLMLHLADHGRLPPDNAHDAPRTLGRLHPA